MGYIISQIQIEKQVVFLKNETHSLISTKYVICVLMDMLILIKWKFSTQRVTNSHTESLFPLFYIWFQDLEIRVMILQKLGRGWEEISLMNITNFQVKILPKS